MLQSGSLENEMRGKIKTFSDIERLYAVREVDIAWLANKGEITAADLAGVDRLGRVEVASVYWSLCTDDAKRALLADAHAHVRSAALLASCGATVAP